MSNIGNSIFPIPSSSIKSDFVGCYSDSDPKIYTDYLGDYDVDTCNKKALAKGYSYFGLQNSQGLTDGKSKCYGGNTVPGTAPYKPALCKITGNDAVDSLGNTLGYANVSAIYKVSQTASLPNNILLNASSSDNWSFGTIEGSSMQLENPSSDEMNVSVLYTKNMKGTGDTFSDIDHGDVSNGGNVKMYNISGNSTISVPCNNNNMGSDPFPGYQKVCYKKTNLRPIVGRYIKLQAGIKPCCMNWGNIYVYSTAGGKNIAKNAKVYMSSKFDDKNSYPGSNLVDENISTFAHTNCNDSNYSWMLVDLGYNVPIHKIILASRQECCSDRGIESTVSIYSSDYNYVYMSGGCPSNDGQTFPRTDPGESSKLAYKYYIITPPLKGVVGTNNMDFNSDYVMERFEGNTYSDNTIVYIIVSLLLIFLMWYVYRNIISKKH